MANFQEQVIKIIRQIPVGKVVTYGQVAALAGSPRAARMVGQILRRGTEKYQLPWQRVIGQKGYLTIVNFNYPAELQASLLKGEGVKVQRTTTGWQVDMTVSMWRPETH